MNDAVPTWRPVAPGGCIRSRPRCTIWVIDHRSDRPTRKGSGSVYPQSALGWNQMVEPDGRTLRGTFIGSAAVWISRCELCGSEPTHGWFEVPIRTRAGNSTMRVCRGVPLAKPSALVDGLGRGRAVGQHARLSPNLLSEGIAVLSRSGKNTKDDVLCVRSGMAAVATGRGRDR
jgi:hypothetical protein